MEVVKELVNRGANVNAQMKVIYQVIRL